MVAVGSVHTGDEAIHALETKADFVALGREIIMDPNWIEKIQNEKEDEITVTISRKPQKELVIPDKLFSAMLDTTGWFPFED